MSFPSTNALESVSSYTLLDQERMSEAKRYFAWQGRLVRPYLGQRVVEFGCGTGNFTGMLLDREAVIAVDVEPECLIACGSATATGEIFISCRLTRPAAEFPNWRDSSPTRAYA